MTPSIDEQLLDLRARLHARDKSNGRLAAVRKQLEEQEQLKQELSKQLEKEGADVKALEGLSLSALFHWIRGDKAEKLEQEREEFTAAILRHEQCSGALQAMHKRMQEIEAAQVDDPGLDELWTTALADKEKWLTSQGGARAKALLSNMQILGDTKANDIELKEAIDAGMEAIDALDDMRNDLDDAESLGTWDMLGGGLTATALKRGAMDRANAAGHKAREKIRLFRVELGDVSAQLTADLELSSFLGFADYFLDNFFVDFAVQRKIQQAQSKVQDALAEISRLIRKLKTEAVQSAEEITRLEAERRRLIEES